MRRLRSLPTGFTSPPHRLRARGFSRQSAHPRRRNSFAFLPGLSGAQHRRNRHPSRSGVSSLRSAHARKTNRQPRVGAAVVPLTRLARLLEFRHSAGACHASTFLTRSRHSCRHLQNAPPPIFSPGLTSTGAPSYVKIRVGSNRREPTPKRSFSRRKARRSGSRAIRPPPRSSITRTISCVRAPMTLWYCSAGFVIDAVCWFNSMSTQQPIARATTPSVSKN